MKNMKWLKKIHVPVLRPESTLRTIWDISIGLITLYSLVFIPVFTFFDQPGVCYFESSSLECCPG